jgi:exopolysaccharide biosynthesis polyprenyl glycosylphosphotransferase
MNLQILGSINNLEKIVLENRPDIVVVALSERRGVFPYREMLNCKMQGVRVEDWPTFYEKLTGKILIQNLRPSWLIFSEGFARTDFVRTMKRMTDILFAAFGLCVSFPLMAFISLLIKLSSRGPIFFKQERVGEHGKVFTLYKFRTMIADAEKETGPVWAQTKDPRTTKLGRLLRRTGLDEIPQLFNVLLGQMTLVGPRIIHPSELPRYGKFASKRLSVKPGITGLWQISGRQHISYDERVMLDMKYIDTRSCINDLLILFKTPKVLIIHTGA